MTYPEKRNSSEAAHPMPSDLTKYWITPTPVSAMSGPSEIPKASKRVKRSDLERLK
jgi:hypothetical protein